MDVSGLQERIYLKIILLRSRQKYKEGNQTCGHKTNKGRSFGKQNNGGKAISRKTHVL